MSNRTLLTGLVLLILGMIGVASMLTMDIPLPAEAEALLKNQFTDQQIKLLLLVNPTILLLISVIVGTVFYQKVGLSAPIIERITGRRDLTPSILTILKHGAIGGVIAGVVLSLVGLAFDPFIPEEFAQLGESVKPTLAARFLYGGITEEIMMRFGLMSFFVWVGLKLFSKERPSAYWIGIVITSLAFGIGHFPVAFQAVESPSAMLLTYILLGNSLGGMVFGWLYWKRGLESAMVAHMIAHMVMLGFEFIL